MIAAGRLTFSVRDASRVTRENFLEAGLLVSVLGSFPLPEQALKPTSNDKGSTMACESMNSRPCPSCGSVASHRQCVAAGMHNTVQPSSNEKGEQKSHSLSSLPSYNLTF